MLPDEVRAALSGIEVGGAHSAERLKHGLTNESWLVRGAAGALVVRLSNTQEVSLQINRASEALILGAAARAGIGPEVIRCDPARHLLVTRYAGETWSEAQVLEERNIERIAHLLRKLHSVSPPRSIQRVDLMAVVDGYLQTLDEHGVGDPAGTPAQQARAREIAATLQQGSELCLCHNDVHSLNIVDDGQLRLIDWEYAGLGERFFDLASICVYHRYDRRQRERLLAAYVSQSQAGAEHRLELACWLFGYVRELWTAVRELG